jgi:hypothetical protein
MRRNGSKKKQSFDLTFEKLVPLVLYTWFGKAAIGKADIRVGDKLVRYIDTIKHS